MVHISSLPNRYCKLSLNPGHDLDKTASDHQHKIIGLVSQFEIVILIASAGLPVPEAATKAEHQWSSGGTSTPGLPVKYGSCSHSHPRADSHALPHATSGFLRQSATD